MSEHSEISANVIKMFSIDPLKESKTDERRPIDKGGEPPDDGDMLKRVEKLESELAAIKTDVAVIRSNYATKQDLHKEIGAQTWKLVTFVSGFGTALAGAVYFIAHSVH